MLEEAAAIKDIASSGKDQLNSPLHVGAIFTIGPYLFPHFIPPLQKAAPQMPLIIEESYTGTLRKQLRNGEVDVIIVALPFSEPDVVVQPLYEEPFIVLLPKDHPLCKKSSIERGDLDHENVLMMGEGHCFRDQVIEALPIYQLCNITARIGSHHDRRKFFGDPLLYGCLWIRDNDITQNCRYRCRISSK